MRNIVVSGNWKMNKTKQDGLNFIEDLKTRELQNYDSIKMIFAPSIMLDALISATEGSEIIIGCQNMHQEEQGAYTGEISASMLKSIGVNNILIGHSERRQYFNETDKIVNQKMHVALDNGLKPTLCVGELLVEREAKITNSVLKEQITKAFDNISAEDAARVIIAYEPVWAIGTGLTASPADANDACKYIRSLIAKLYTNELAENIIIQYGGSVSPTNVDELLSQSDIDGGLVGGASLDVDSYVKLLK